MKDGEFISEKSEHFIQRNQNDSLRSDIVVHNTVTLDYNTHPNISSENSKFLNHSNLGENSCDAPNFNYSFAASPASSFIDEVKKVDDNNSGAMIENVGVDLHSVTGPGSADVMPEPEASEDILQK